MKKKLSVLLIQIAIVAAFLGIWEITARMGLYNTGMTSYPTRIAQDLVEFYQSGALVKHTSITLTESFLGLIIGSISGIVLGFVLGYFKILGKVFLPMVTALHAIPQLTLAPIYILWFGLGMTSKVFLSTLMVFFLVFFATYGAFENIDNSLVESAALLGAGPGVRVSLVIFPSCLPYIIHGVRSGVGAALVGAIIGEYMGASSGFGWMIAYASSYFKIERVMSCIFILLVVGIILNWLLQWLESTLLKWQNTKIDYSV